MRLEPTVQLSTASQEADQDEGVRANAAQVLGSLLTVYQGRKMVESTGVVSNLRKALFDSSGDLIQFNSISWLLLSSRVSCIVLCLLSDHFDVAHTEYTF